MTGVLPYPRCSSWAREIGADPAGTAPRFDVLVLVERPLPWPRDPGAEPALGELARIAAEQAGQGRTVRLQAGAAAEERSEHRVVVFDRGPGPFAGYGRSEGAGATRDLPDLVADLVGTPVPPPATPDVTDVLICTHGTRDRCCGALGTRLWSAAEPRLGGARVWRTSHTGGHRFAPTAMTFPDGGCWAYLDAGMLTGLVERTLPAAAAAAHLRGCTAFGPALQVADREVLATRGWGWLSCTRSGEDLGTDRVELCFSAPDGGHGTYEVRLERGRDLPVPDCGADPAAAVKSQTELRVAQLRLRS